MLDQTVMTRIRELGVCAGSLDGHDRKARVVQRRAAAVGSIK